MNLYGIIIGIALIVGIEYFSKNNHTIPKNKENIFIIGFSIFALLGARTYHVIDQWTYYQHHPQQIIQTWNGGLGIYGALIAITVYIYLFAKRYQLSFLKILDTITPILPLCQSIGRIGNYFNHEIPIWWLEASLNLFLFFVIKKSKKFKKYNPTAIYLIGYGLIRFIIEFFRHDTWMINNLKIAQIISLISIFTGLYLFNSPKTKT